MADSELPVDAVGNLDQTGGNSFGIGIAEQAARMGFLETYYGGDCTTDAALSCLMQTPRVGLR